MDITKEPKVKIDLLERLAAPILNTKTIAISVRRYFTDVNGTLVDKLAVPIALQTDYPLYVLGEFDRQGAYFIGQRVIPNLPGYFFLTTFTWGLTNPFFFGFTGLSEIQSRINSGDIVTVYTDDLQAPNFFVWIVQSTSITGKASLASVLTNSHTHNKLERPGYSMITVDRIYYYTDNDQQWNKALLTVITDELGSYKHDAQDAMAYKLPYLQQNNFIDLKIKFCLNQYIGLYTYLLFDTDSINLTFKIKN